MTPNIKHIVDQIMEEAKKRPRPDMVNNILSVSMEIDQGILTEMRAIRAQERTEKHQKKETKNG